MKEVNKIMIFLKNSEYFRMIANDEEFILENFSGSSLSKLICIYLINFRFDSRNEFFYENKI